MPKKLKNRILRSIAALTVAVQMAAVLHGFLHLPHGHGHESVLQADEQVISLHTVAKDIQHQRDCLYCQLMAYNIVPGLQSEPHPAILYAKDLISELPAAPCMRYAWRSPPTRGPPSFIA